MTIDAPRNKIGVKEAVKAATEAIKDLLPGPDLGDLRLEEVEQTDDERYWLITLGYSVRQFSPIVPLPLRGHDRIYKQFKVDADTGRVMSMKIRSL
jgi:hypothetical protein